MATVARRPAQKPDESDSDERLESITLESLQGVWLHSNKVLGTVVVKDNIAKLGKLTLHLWESNNSVEMKGWRAKPKASTDHEILWVSQNGERCKWYWEGEEEDIVPILPAGVFPQKRKRRIVEPESDLIIKNPTVILPDSKRRKGIGHSSSFAQLLQSGSDSEHCPTALDAVRLFKQWMLTTNNSKVEDYFLSNAKLSKHLSIHLPVGGQQEFVRRMETQYAIPKTDVLWDQSRNEKGNVSVMVTSAARHHFARKFPQEWAAAKGAITKSSGSGSSSTKSTSSSSSSSTSTSGGGGLVRSNSTGSNQGGGPASVGPTPAGGLGLDLENTKLALAGGAMDEEEAIRRLTALSNYPMNIEILKQSKIGKVLADYSNACTMAQVKKLALKIVHHWRDMYRRAQTPKAQTPQGK